MRTFHWLFLVTLTIFLGGAVIAGQGGPQEKPCDVRPAPAMGLGKPGATPPSGMSPKVKIKDIMNSMMVPSSNAVWNSVATVTDATGVHESRPNTDEDWNNVYHSAVELTEVANLLMVPGRSRCVGGAIPAQYRADFNQKAREMIEAGEHRDHRGEEARRGRHRRSRRADRRGLRRRATRSIRSPRATRRTRRRSSGPTS